MPGNNISSFVTFFQVFIALFLIASLYHCLKHRAAARVYWNFGKNMAAAFVMIELALFLLGGSTVSSSWIIPFHFISISIYVIGGMMIARQLKVPSLPMLAACTRSRKDLLPYPAATYLKVIIFYSLAVCIFTALLFKFTHPEISDFLKEAIEEEKTLAVHRSVQWSSILFFLLVAFYEEVIFRLFIQTFFLRVFRKFFWAVPAAIFLSSTLFAVGHFGVLATWWVKFVQTLVLGIVLGHAMKKYGMETSFAIHSILNIFALYASGFLLGI